MMSTTNGTFGAGAVEVPYLAPTNPKDLLDALSASIDAGWVRAASALIEQLEAMFAEAQPHELTVQFEALREGTAALMAKARSEGTEAVVNWGHPDTKLAMRLGFIEKEELMRNSAAARDVP